MNTGLLSGGNVSQVDRLMVTDGASIADAIGRLFQEIFQTDVGEDDDFFDLGGDSLAGETLLAGIEQEFGVSLPLSILLESSTPRLIADAVAAKKKAALPTILFTASKAGSRTPLFCIHGFNGTASFSRKIREVLSDRPIYAIRAPGLLPGEVPLISVPEMAKSYIGEIRRVRPSGPYHIFGQCGTANVAYEVAQQLTAAGERVATLTLGDPGRPKRRTKLRRLYFRLAGRRAIRTALLNPQMSGDERMEKVVKPALRAAIKAHVSLPYSGNVLVVVASHNAAELLHPKRGYPALVPHLETVVVEGNHMDVFTGPAPGAEGELARSMSEFLRRHD